MSAGRQRSREHPSMFSHEISAAQARPLNAAQKLGVVKTLRRLGAADLIPMLTGDPRCSA